MKKGEEFTLNGKVEKKGNKYFCEVRLNTPDGKITKITSDPIYTTEKEAELALEIKLSEVLHCFTHDHSVEVVSRSGGKVQ